MSYFGELGQPPPVKHPGDKTRTTSVNAPLPSHRHRHYTLNAAEKKKIKYKEVQFALRAGAPFMCLQKAHMMRKLVFAEGVLMCVCVSVYVGELSREEGCNCLLLRSSN